MRRQRFTLPGLLLLACSTLACDLGPKSIGSLDGADSEGTPPMEEQPNSCGEPGASAQFELLGLGDGTHDLSLTCDSALSPTDTGYSIALTNCVNVDHPDYAALELRLDGDWSEPLVDGQQVEVRYIEVPIAVVVDEVSHDHGVGRWLSLATPSGQVAVPLIAVDAPLINPFPSIPFEFDMTPLSVQFETADCGLIEHPECPDIEPGALSVGFGGELFSAAEGSNILMMGGNDENVHLIVERARAFSDVCLEYPAAYQFGAVALANG